MVNDYYVELIQQRPIDYNGLKIYPISFEFICENIGLKNFDNLLFPFMLVKDCLNIPEDKLDEINLFEDIILRDETMLFSLIAILNIFCKCDNIQLEENRLALIFSKDIESEESDDFVFHITKDNFDDICEIILKICAKKKIEVEKPPKNMSAKQKDIWEKLQEGRRREEKRNEVHIYDILNMCEFAGNYHISQDEIKKWTLWKIYNCYQTRISIKNYDDALKIALVSGNSENISGDNHWYNKLRICE